MSQVSSHQRPGFGRETALRGPFVFFFVAALVWLLAASALGLIAALKLWMPSFLNCEWLTYGRVTIVQKNLFIYGWATNALLAVNLWLLSRLTSFEFRNGWIAVFGGLVWNATLIYGVQQIFAGFLNGFSLLEMPREVGPVFAIAFLLAGFWPVVAFARRPSGHTFAAQWYVVGASFLFPIFYLIAQLLVLWCPASGVVQALVASWFVQNLLQLWLAASALGIAYYFIPKVLERPLAGYYLATVGFWTFFLFAGWTAPATLLGSPIPVWIQSVGVVAMVMSIVPIIITAINFHGTFAQNGGWANAWNSTSLRWVALGTISFTFVGLLRAIFYTRGYSAIVRFTEFYQGLDHLLVYGFVTMVIFGAAYFILPRVTGALWPSVKLIHVHFWSVTLALIVSTLVSLYGGYQTGLDLSKGAPQMIGGGKAHVLTAAAFLLGHAAFALNALGLIFRGLTSAENRQHD